MYVFKRKIIFIIVYLFLYIIGTSRNSRLIYEVGKCLSNAVVREWDTHLCPNGMQLNNVNMAESMPYQLLCYLLQWVATYGNEVNIIIFEIDLFLELDSYNICNYTVIFYVIISKVFECALL